MKVRFSAPLFLVGLLFVPSIANGAVQTTPSTTLHFGDTNPQVLFLQQVLNQATDTQVALTGIGSPGMESTYFGIKTLDAVKRYQTKYRSEILSPANLAVPTGVVGPLTLQRLKKSSAPSSTIPASSILSPPTSINPLDLYIAAVTQTGMQQGYASTTIALITDKIRATTASTTDFQTQFFKEQQALYQKKVSMESSKPFAEKVFNKLALALIEMVLPEKAQAAAGLPFGGYITYSNPAVCSCTPGVTSVFVSLPNPTLTSNLLLDYVAGTEAFNWHTLPLPGVSTLGTYAPGYLTCYIYVGTACLPIPAVGTITPMSGSSLVP